MKVRHPISFHHKATDTDGFLVIRCHAELHLILVPSHPLPCLHPILPDEQTARADETMAHLWEFFSSLSLSFHVLGEEAFDK